MLFSPPFVVASYFGPAFSGFNLYLSQYSKNCWKCNVQLNSILLPGERRKGLKNMNTWDTLQCWKMVMYYSDHLKPNFMLPREVQPDYESILHNLCGYGKEKRNCEMNLNLFPSVGKVFSYGFGSLCSLIWQFFSLHTEMHAIVFILVWRAESRKGFCSSVCAWYSHW